MQDLENNTRRPDAQLYIGIDVSKRHLDIFIDAPSQGAGSEPPRQLRVDNTLAGHKGLARQIAALKAPALIAMEATGRYHRAAHKHMHAEGLSVCVLNPFHTHSFHKALGLNTKTDRIDAAMLARFARIMEPRISSPPPKSLERLKEILVARRQFIRQATRLSLQLKETALAPLRAMMETQARGIKRHIKKCDALIRAAIANESALQARYDIIASVPGVGFVNAATLLADMPELGTLNEKQAAALLGVAPHANQSGNYNGKSFIRGGRKTVRDTFYMAALSSIRSDAGFKAFHTRLTNKGKPYKVAAIAVMRKMIILINALLRDGRKYQPKPA